MADQKTHNASPRDTLQRITHQRRAGLNAPTSQPSLPEALQKLKDMGY